MGMDCLTRQPEFYFISYDKRRSVTDLHVYTICKTSIAVSFQITIFFSITFFLLDWY